MNKLFAVVIMVAIFIIALGMCSTPEQSNEEVEIKPAVEEVAPIVAEPEPSVPDTAFEYKPNLLKLKKRKDEFEGITWYKTTSFNNGNVSNKIYVYVGETERNAWTRIYVSYFGEDWIFFDKIIFLVDGDPIELQFDDYKDKKTEVVSGGVYEWVDVPGADYSILLSRIIMAETVKVKLSGKYSYSWTLSKSEKEGIKDAVYGYYYLKSIK